MRILIDCHCFDVDTTEGINTYIRGIYGAMPRLAPDIDFYFAAQNIDKIKAIFGEGVNIHYLPLKERNRYIRLLFELPKIIFKNRIDWAHFQYIAPIYSGCKTIVTLHDLLVKDYPDQFPKLYRKVKEWNFRRSAKRADILCTVSEYSAESITHHYKIARQRITVTPNAVSEEFANVGSSDIEKFKRDKQLGRYILLVSRIEPRKNQAALLRAWRRLRHEESSYEDIELVMIGRHSLSTPDFENELQTLSAEERAKVRMIENSSGYELMLWYAGASLFVYPALAEGFGIPPLEAAMAGVPVICSNATAMRDYDFFGKNHIDVTDNDLLYERIKHSLQNPLENDNIRNEIRSRYKWSNSARRLFERILVEN